MLVQFSARGALRLLLGGFPSLPVAWVFERNRAVRSCCDALLFFSFETIPSLSRTRTRLFTWFVTFDRWRNLHVKLVVTLEELLTGVVKEVNVRIISM